MDGVLVSIPFIAGQWSLQEEMKKESNEDKARFNPLHCGAVVASRMANAIRAAGATGFNPLHCGAVVASRTARTGCGRR